MPMPVAGIATGRSDTCVVLRAPRARSSRSTCASGVRPDVPPLWPLRGPDVGGGRGRRSAHPGAGARPSPVAASPARVDPSASDAVGPPRSGRLSGVSVITDASPASSAPPGEQPVDGDGSDDPTPPPPAAVVGIARGCRSLGRTVRPRGVRRVHLRRAPVPTSCSATRRRPAATPPPTSGGRRISVTTCCRFGSPAGRPTSTEGFRPGSSTSRFPRC